MKHDDYDNDENPRPALISLKGKKLAVVETVDGFIIAVDGVALETPLGRPVHHFSEKLIKSMAKQLQEAGEADPGFLGLYSLYCTQVDFIERRKDALETEFQHMLLHDIALRTCAGPEEAQQLHLLEPLITWFKELRLEHPRLPQTVECETLAEWIGSHGAGDKFREMGKALEVHYRSMTPAQKTVVLNAMNIHGSLTMGMLLALGRIEPNRYGKAIKAVFQLDPEGHPEQFMMQPSYWMDAEEMAGYLRLVD